MRRWLALCLFTLGIVPVVLFGCNTESKELKAELELMKIEVKRLRERVSILDAKVAVLKTAQTLFDTAVLDPSSKGYQRIDANCGFFLISLKEIKPYLDGCKVSLQIGNPSAVVYSGFVLKVKWGKRFDEGQNYDEWEKSLRQKEEKFTQDLKPGLWNKVEINVSPAKPEELGHLEISMKTDVVKLFGG